MRLSRCGWTLLGTVTLGLAVLTSCNKVDTDDLAKKIAKELRDGDKPYHPVAVGDDQPIIIAGGSMNFVAPVGLFFVKDTGAQALRYTAPTGTVISSVDVIGPDVNDQMVKQIFAIVSGQDPNIQLTYDKKKGSGNDAEIVTIAAPIGTDLKITSSTKDMSTAHSISDRFWSHPKQHKSMSKVQVGANPAVTCGNFGECSVVIHYCPTSGTCTPH